MLDDTEADRPDDAAARRVDDDSPADAGAEAEAEPGAAEADTERDGAGGTDSSTDDALLSRLRLIEERPLDERADAYTRIHGELVDALEGDYSNRQDV
jgi:hypothetical protein